MKSLLKFTLLSALIIGGKLAKQTPPTAGAQITEKKTAPGTSLVFVNQFTPSEPVKTEEEKKKEQQRTAGLLADMF